MAANETNMALAEAAFSLLAQSPGGLRGVAEFLAIWMKQRCVYIVPGRSTASAARHQSWHAHRGFDGNHWTYHIPPQMIEAPRGSSAHSWSRDELLTNNKAVVFEILLDPLTLLAYHS